MQVVLSVTLSHLNCVLGDFLCPLTTSCKTFCLIFGFYLCFIGTELAFEITLTEWLKVPNSRYYCSWDFNAFSISV